MGHNTIAAMLDEVIQVEKWWCAAKRALRESMVRREQAEEIAWYRRSVVNEIDSYARKLEALLRAADNRLQHVDRSTTDWALGHEHQHVMTELRRKWAGE